MEKFMTIIVILSADIWQTKQVWPDWVFSSGGLNLNMSCSDGTELKGDAESVRWIDPDEWIKLGKGAEKKARIFYGLLPNPPSDPPRYGLFTDKKNYPYFFFRK